jgi:hypothetical protein
MRRQLPILPALLLSFASMSASAADEPAPIEGTFLIGNHTYQAKQVVAYESKLDGEDEEASIVIFVSDRKIPIAEIKAKLAEDDGEDRSLFISQPHIRFVFKKTGEPTQCSAWADNSSFQTSGETLSGNLKLEDGKVAGEGKLAEDPDSQFKRSAEIKFNLALGLDNAPKKKPSNPGAPVKPSVTGTFKGNGKDSKLAFISAKPGESFADKPSITIVITEKDHSKSKKPDFDAGFGKFGSALILRLHEDGGIFGCEVAHSAHKEGAFSSSGSIKTVEFDAEDGRIAGQLVTDGEEEFFGRTWEVDLKFEVPYVAAAAPTKPTDQPASKPSTPAKRGNKPVAKKDAPKDEPKDEPTVDADAINVHALPYPKDATDFEYKQLVEFVEFKTPTKPQATATAFAKALKEQGWENEGGDLLTAKNSILSKKRGNATLKIFVMPDGTGSQVRLMTEGLDWSEKEEKEK